MTTLSAREGVAEPSRRSRSRLDLLCGVDSSELLKAFAICMDVVPAILSPSPFSSLSGR